MVLNDVRNAERDVVVLGSTGFIGKNVAECMAEDHMFDVSGFSSDTADLQDYDETLSLEKLVPKGSVLIMAAGVTRDKKEPFLGMIANIKMATNLASFISHYFLSHVIFLSTVDVYGRRNLTLPLSESSKIQPDSYYSISKYASELILEKVCFDRGIDLTILRLPGVYGPKDPHNSPIKIFINSSIKGAKNRVYGNGSQMRDFLYIDDVHRVITTVILNKITGTFNVVTGKSYTINEVLDLIENISDSGNTRFYEESNMDELDLIFNKSELLSHVPDFCFTELSSGLQKTYESIIAAK